VCAVSAETSHCLYLCCIQAKLAGLEEQVAELSGRVHSLELEKARYRAERDALSQRVDTLQSSSGPRPPTPEQLARTCSRSVRVLTCTPCLRQGCPPHSGCRA